MGKHRLHAFALLDEPGVGICLGFMSPVRPLHPLLIELRALSSTGDGTLVTPTLDRQPAMAGARFF